MTEDVHEVIIPEDNAKERLDCILAHSLELDLSRNYIQRLIREGLITANGNIIKQNYRVRTGDSIIIRFPKPKTLEISSEKIPVEILYEDDDIAVINKSPGIVVHPGPGNWEHTLVNALLYHISKLSTLGGPLRPGIVHRLDKDTAGLMIIAKNDSAHAYLTREFQERNVIKKYITLTTGKPSQERGTIDGPIDRHPVYRHKMTVRQDGKEAHTEYQLKKVWNLPEGTFSLFEIIPRTGRTHQIRVHMASLGLPIIGDPIYSKKWAKHRVPFLLLASIFLELTHPASRKRISFQATVPDHINKFIEKLDKG